MSKESLDERDGLEESRYKEKVLERSEIDIQRENKL